VSFGCQPQQAAIGVECLCPPGFVMEALSPIDGALTNSAIYPKHEIPGVRAETRDLDDLCGSCGGRDHKGDPGLMPSKAGIVSILLGN
jgi:hypothetical protein